MANLQTGKQTRLRFKAVSRIAPRGCETEFFAGVRLALEGLRILARHASVW